MDWDEFDMGVVNLESFKDHATLLSVKCLHQYTGHFVRRCHKLGVGLLLKRKDVTGEMGSRHQNSKAISISKRSEECDMLVILPNSVLRQFTSYNSSKEILVMIGTIETVVTISGSDSPDTDRILEQMSSNCSEVIIGPS